MISRLRSSSSSSSGRKALPYLVIGAAFVATVAYVLTVLPLGVGRSAQPPNAAPPSPIPHSDGLSDSFEGYRMVPVTLPETRGKAIPVSFRILGPDGAPLTSYETVQAKSMHLFLIRQDVSGYQHLHPVLQGDLWSAPVDLDDGGSYRLYAEFTPRGWRGSAPGNPNPGNPNPGNPNPGNPMTGNPMMSHPIILGLAFVIAGDTKLAPLPAPAPTSPAGPFTVERLDGTSHLYVNRSTLLRLRVHLGGNSVTLEPYLDAIAHMSAFEVRTQGLIHLHPGGLGGELTFHTQFPNRGEYGLFLEFQVSGTVYRAAFTVFVT